MNVLPLLKLHLRESIRSAWILLILPLYFGFALETNLQPDIYVLPGICCLMCAAMAMSWFTQLATQNEFSYSLPFSPKQVFLTQFAIQQILFLCAFILTITSLLLANKLPWDWRLGTATLNAITCNISISLWLFCFWRPQVYISRIPLTITIMPIVFLVGGVLFATVAFTTYVSLLPCCAALILGIPAFFKLRRTLEEIEPLTGKRPLYEMKIKREQQFQKDTNDKISSQKTASDTLPKQEVTQASWFYRSLKKRLSPTAQYILLSIWSQWIYLAAFLTIALMLGGMIVGMYDPNFKMGTVALFFGFIGGIGLLTMNRSALRALNPLPIDSRRLFHWLFGPWLVMILLIIVLAFVMQYHQRNIKFRSHPSKTLSLKNRSSEMLRNSDLDSQSREKQLQEKCENLKEKVMALYPSTSNPPDLEKLNDAICFSELIWKDYAIEAPPEKLFRYASKWNRWEVSIRPFVEKCRAARMHFGLMNSLAILFAILFGIVIVTFEKQPFQHKKPANQNELSQPSVNKINKWRYWPDRIVAWTIFALIFLFWVSMLPKNPIVEHVNLKPFVMTHLTGCYIGLLVGIGISYRLCLCCIRRIH